MQANKRYYCTCSPRSLTGDSKPAAPFITRIVMSIHSVHEVKAVLMEKRLVVKQNSYYKNHSILLICEFKHFESKSLQNTINTLDFQLIYI